MSRVMSLLPVVLALGALTRPVAAQCTSDSHCRGGRLCVEGECRDAPQPPCTRDIDCPEPLLCVSGACVTREEASVAAVPTEWFAGYAVGGALISWVGWDRLNGDSGRRGEYDTRFMDVGGGVYLAGYGAIVDEFHVGGYFAWFQAGDPLYGEQVFGLGVSVSAGGRLGPRVRLGGVLDMGAHVALPEGAGIRTGIQVFPRLQVDVLCLDGPIKLGIFVALGPLIAPWYRGDVSMDDRGTGWAVWAQTLIGMTLGG